MKTFVHLTGKNPYRPKDFKAVRTITYDEDNGGITCWVGIRKNGETVDISEELGQETLDYFDLWAIVEQVEFEKNASKS